MNTTQAAQKLGTTPRTLRQFLRSPISTFKAVGSGARYEFDESEIPMLRKRFQEWSGKPKTTKTSDVDTRPLPDTRKDDQAQRDQQARRDREVWAEEGTYDPMSGRALPIELPDIRDPRVRARVRQAEREREERLTMLLISRGMHVSQWGDR